jgi:5-methylthioribose kinase
MELLTTESVGSYLVERGVAAAGEPISAVSLGGGVSNVVLAVRVGERRVVVKQSLPQLRVADEWLAKRERILTEAAALRWASRVTPGAVPAVYDVDPERCAIVIEHASDGWRNWKDDLLAGQAEPAVADRLGVILAAWHTASFLKPDEARRFDDSEAFEQLRVDPYYRTVMRRHPELEALVRPYVDQMLATHRCLVHGDYSPKNVLLGDDGLWVVDFEVGHLGDPVFDVAFLLNHLLLKAIHCPGTVDAYARCADAFWTAYVNGTSREVRPADAYVFGHVGCLMVARVDGKSPAEYLTVDERVTARALGIRLLREPPIAPAGAWRLLEEMIWPAECGMM